MSIDVTCLCLTHGRPWLLAEAVESFRRQRLGGLTAELLVLNDCPEQTLTCGVPGVVIENMPAPVRDVSTKFNHGILRARGKWIAFWDDDDISLPLRIADGVRLIGDKDAYRPTLCWNWGCGEIRYVGKPLLCQGMVRRDVSIAVGLCTSGEYNDKSLWDKIWPRLNSVQTTPRPQDMQYIYRWAGVGWHESGAGEPDSAVRAEQFRRAALADPRFEAGEIEVVPAWRQEYGQMVWRAIGDGKGDIIR